MKRLVVSSIKQALDVKGLLFRLHEDPWDQERLGELYQRLDENKALETEDQDMIVLETLEEIDYMYADVYYQYLEKKNKMKGFPV